MKMNKYVKEFLHRGLMFSGFGPIILGIIALFEPAVMIDGKTVFIAIVSTYLLAFIQAGASVFYSVETWSTAKSMFFHFLMLYIIYVTCYLANSWIPFDITVVGIFTAIFVIVYFMVWLIVYSCIKSASKKMNENLKR